MLKMMQSKKGFTLIELVMIIVILGILAAVAVPKYIDLKDDALDASFNGVCGGLKSSAGVLIASSFAGYPRGSLKQVATVIANSDVTPASTQVAGTTVTVTIQGSSRACDLSAVAIP